MVDGGANAGSSGFCSRRVLVVDDTRDLAKMMELVLKKLGHEVRMAYDAPTALEAADSYQPEIVLIDIRLPGMDGYELARKLRRHPACEHARLVAVTGYAQERDRIRSLEAGFDEHLVKPVDLATLEGIFTS